MRRYASLNRADCSWLLAGIVLALLIGERPMATFGQDEKPATEKKKEESKPDASPSSKPEEKQGKSDPVAPPDAFSRAELEERLEEEVDFAFLDVPLADAVEAFAQRMRIQIIIDRKALDDEGIGTDKPVDVSLAKLRACRFLDVMLEPLGLTWIAEDGYVLVTSATRASEKTEIRIYQVRDLVATTAASYPMMMPMPAPGLNTSTGFPGMGPFPMPMMPGMGPPTGMVPNGLGVPAGPFPAPSASPVPGPSNPPPANPNPATPATPAVPAAPTPGSGGGGGGFFGVPSGSELGTGRSQQAALAQFGGMAMSTAGKGGMAPPTNEPNLDVAPLLDLVQTTVHPEAWSDTGGMGSIHYSPGGLLVIRQTGPIHRELQRFFAMLREARESDPGAVVTQ